MVPRSLVVALAIVALPCGSSIGQSTRVALKSRTFEPREGIDAELMQQARAATRSDRLHFLMQFQRLPSPAERVALNRDLGITLLDPVPQTAYFVSAPRELLLRGRLPQQVRWAGRIAINDKMAPVVRRSSSPTLAIRDSAPRAAMLVQFFGDASIEAQRQALHAYGITDFRRIEYLNAWSVILARDSVVRLATEDAVKWLTVVPQGPEADNDGVRSSTGVNADAVLASTFYNLSGGGITVASWDPSPASLGHLDFAGRITLGDPPLPYWARTQAHDESVSGNKRFDSGEAVYRDVDDNGIVSDGDKRYTQVGAFAIGSTVGPTDPDALAATPLVSFWGGDDVDPAPPERFFDVNNDFVWEATEPIYIDTNKDGAHDGGDVLVYSNGVTPSLGAKYRAFPTSPHGHATMVAGTIMGNGAGSASNQWKGVAPAAKLRTYAICSTGACVSSEWLVGSDASWVASISNDHVDASGNGTTIAAHAWGPRLSHCHQQPFGSFCYDELSELYDVITSGLTSTGAPSGKPRMFLIGSAGNVGRPERHTENVPLNGKYDDGEAIYVDSAGDGTVSSGDLRLLGPDQPAGSLLVDFALQEMHTEQISDTGTFNEGERVYLDSDRSGSITPGDIRITPTGMLFTSGSTVTGVDSDVTTEPTRLRSFVFWAGLRIGNSAKNTLQVGAIASDAPFLPSFSSRGPTADGRIKPDVVAAGSRNGGEAFIRSTYTRNRYWLAEGTSMATGASAGVAALLAEFHKKACSSTGPTPEVLKALLVHGAEDVVIPASGAFAGPDYASGFGRLRAKEAIDLVPHHMIGAINGAAAAPQLITVARTKPLKVTLVWNDAPWPANSAPGSNGILQNDLDLTLEAPDGSQYSSWRLDPTNPATPAARDVFPSGSPVPESSRDRRNTIEQVVVDDAQAGTWKILVTAPRLGLGPQTYALVSEALSPASSPCATTPSADVWVRDNTGDTGAVPSSGLMWLGPDLWNRLADDGLLDHQNPEYGQKNYLYAQVRNASGVAVAATTMEFWIADASTGLSWPTSFTSVGRIFVPNLAPNEVRQIGPLPWYPPPPGMAGHFCMYVRLISPQDPIMIVEGSGITTNARTSNNIAYRNLHIVDLASSRSETFVVRNISRDFAYVDLAVRVPPEFLQSGATYVALAPTFESLLRRSQGTVRGAVSLRDSGWVERPSDAQGVARPPIPYRITASEAVFARIRLGPMQTERMTVTFRSTDQRVASYDVDIVQYVGSEVIGGIRYVVRTGHRR